MWLALLLSTAPAHAERPAAEFKELYKALRKIPHGGQSDWDAAVLDRMVDRFDADGSSMIDTAAEVESVPCEIWRLLDDKIAKGRGGNASMRVTYVNPPWLTHLIGVDQVVESEMFATLDRCGLR